MERLCSDAPLITRNGLQAGAAIAQYQQQEKIIHDPTHGDVLHVNEHMDTSVDEWVDG